MTILLRLQRPHCFLRQIRCGRGGLFRGDRHRLPPLLWGLVGIAMVLLTAPVMPAAQAQVPADPPADIAPAASPNPDPDLPLTLPTIEKLFLSEPSAINRADVRLDGRRLFVITAARIEDPINQMDGDTPIEVRLETIERRLRRIASQPFDPDSLDVFSEVDGNTQLPVIYARYSRNDETFTDELITVTTLDAQVYATSLDERGRELTRIIAESLLRAYQERQPEFLLQQVWRTAALLLAMVLGSTAITWFQRRLKTERYHLDAEARTDVQRLSVVTDDNISTEVTTALLQQQIATRQQRNVNDIERRLMQFGQLIVWGGGMYLGLGLFPHSRWLQPVILEAIKIPARMLLVVGATYLTIRLSSVLIDRFFWVLQNSSSIAPEASQRLALRFSTFSSVVKSMAVLLLGSIGIIITLSIIGVEIAPLLAGAGIIGLGISFASQSLIKDVINGFLILLEDQYGVGDVIIVGEVGGFVEHMNLRITQLRNEEGRLITIPNSSIAVVQNLSKEWSRVDLMIDVAHTADIDQALAVIKQVAQEMSVAAHWRDLILEHPLLLGVDKLDHMGATVRLWIKTQPLKQWDVAREYRRRLKLAFDREGIPIGVPQQAIWFRNMLDVRRDSPNGARSLDGQQLTDSQPTDWQQTPPPPSPQN